MYAHDNHDKLIGNQADNLNDTNPWPSLPAGLANPGN